MSIAELISELEASTGPNRWLDAKIDALFRIGTEKMRGGGYEWAWKNFPTWAHGYPTFRVGTHQNAPALKSRSKVDRLIP